MRRVTVMLAVLLLAGRSFPAVSASASTPADASESVLGPVRNGPELAEKMRALAPTEDTHFTGSLQIRHSDGDFAVVPLSVTVRTGSDHWETIYQTSGSPNQLPERLTVVHAPSRPNLYLYAQATAAQPTLDHPRRLQPAEAMIRLAHSDFFLADLGLEFFYWPHQKLLKGEMRKGRGCYVLESRPADASASPYSRVLSWIDRESGGLLIAEAYDQQGKLLKEFEIRGVTKVAGQWQVKKMEIRNDQADTRTTLVFDFK